MINTLISLEMSKETIMEKMTIDAFKEQSYIEIIESIMKMNNGYVTSKELSNLGIHRMYLNIMKDKGMIEKVGNGIYIDSRKIEDIYDLGLTEIKTPMGNNVRVYDIERCICDIIKSKNRMDLEHVKYSIREYLKRKDKNLIKLSNYAKEEVINYVEVFYE